ncbi:MAG: phosphoglycerate kinase [Phycisphaerales bacterium]
MAKLSIEKVDVAGKRVLVRVDFNVPMEDGRITDDRRISAAVPTIQSITRRGGRVIVMSHLGRPSGSGYEADQSLKPVAARLGELLGQKVEFPSTDCVDDSALSASSSLADGEVLLLENLRFHAGETSNDPEFAAKLARHGEIFCNDAFGAAHRAHASIVGVPSAMPNAPKAAGLLMLKELRYLSDILEDPERPFVAVLGGAKVSDKLGAIRRLLDRVDIVLVGGAMAYTFLHELGRRVGSSRVESDCFSDARAIIDKAAEHRADMFLPSDHVCGKGMTEQTPIEVFADHIEEGWAGYDIGPKTQALYEEKIRSAKTIVWNGPMGVFEVGPFAVGTEMIARAIAEATKRGATTVIGGGDSAAAVERFDLADQYTHVSTGGGASLQMLEGESLPGVDALTDD